MFQKIVFGSEISDKQTKDKVPKECQKEDSESNIFKIHFMLLCSSHDLMFYFLLNMYV